MLNRFVHILYRLFIVLVVFTITRGLFFIFNLDSFKPILWKQVFNSFFYGIRFDYTAVYLYNFPWLIICLAPEKIWNKKWYQRFQKILFIAVNTVLVILNLSDIEYFKFINSRSGFDVIQTMFLSIDVLKNFPSFALTYWYLLIFLFVFLYFFMKLFDLKINIIRLHVKKWYYIFLIYFLFHAISISFVRGFKLKPLRVVSAVEYVSPKYAPLILNTPFTIIKTVNEKYDKQFNFYPDGEFLKYYNPQITIKSNKKRKDLNVVIIILESFNKEYIGKLSGYESYTPFLDSLISESLYASNGISNSRRSMDAIPAILSSIPSLTDKSLITSRYSVNKLNSIAGFLKSKKYSTAFFHGGRNGTMGFDAYCKGIGIDKYYGLNEYPYPEDFDGSWGIPDEEFLKFAASEMNNMKEPFLTAIFTLSSHHPYIVPEKYKGKFKKGKLEIHEPIQYTDYALHQFFSEIKSMEWFKNTLFVICADHTSLSEHLEYKNPLGFFKIPIIFYNSTDTILRGEIKHLVQQIDIFPTVLDYLNYDTSYISYGKSVFSDGLNFAVNNLNNNFIYIGDTTAMLFDGDDLKTIYNYKRDSLLQNNLIGLKEESGYKYQFDVLKAYLQSYYNRLIKNELSDVAK